MKKIIIVLLGVLVLASCSKDSDWSGSHSNGEYAGFEYMLCFADNLIVDNLKQMETALYIDANSTGGTSSRFERSGSVWDAGSVWTVTEKGGALKGLHISRAAADSTWTLSRNGKYSFFSYSRWNDEDEYAFDTDYSFTVHMLQDTTAHPAADHYWWEVSVNKCERIEDQGYKAVISATSPILYTHGVFCSWEYCFGSLGMQVFKDGEIIDVARLQINGTRNDTSYIRNL